MRYMDSCFVCTTPFQIITAVLLAMDGNGKSDIYISAQFPDAESCCKRLEQYQLFSKAIYVDESKIKGYKVGNNKVYIWIKIFLDYFRVKKIAEKILVNNTVYKTLYCSSKAYTGRMLELYFQKYSQNVETVLFDDGIGSYFNSRLITSSKIDRFLRTIATRKIYKENKKTIYLYSPQLFYQTNIQPNIKEVRKIQISKYRNELLNICNKIFCICEDDYIRETCIILDSLNSVVYTEEDNNKLQQIYDRFCEIIGWENTIVKKHPRDKDENNGSRKIYSNNRIPFECICMNVDMGQKILVSVSSSSVVTPKLMFDQEPVVILLYKVLPPKNILREKMDSFFYCCRELYTRKEKFFIPNSIEELEAFLSCKNWVKKEK